MEIKEKTEWVDVILSMSIDFKMGRISWETYTKNLEWMSKKIKEDAQHT